MTDHPFQTSIGELLSIAREEAGAEGYALYEFEEENREPVLRYSQGVTPRQPGAVLSFSLEDHTGSAGTLDFGFPEPGALSPAQRQVLERAAAVVGELLKRRRSEPFLMRLVKRIVEVEAQLADLKLSERARGLARLSPGSRRFEILHAHAANVLESSGIEQTLAAQLKELEQKLGERQLVAQAKTALQQALDLSEEEAYLMLRNRSRRTRTRLAAVARGILDENRLLGRFSS